MGASIGVKSARKFPVALFCGVRLPPAKHGKGTSFMHCSWAVTAQSLHLYTVFPNFTLFPQGLQRSAISPLFF